MAESVENAAPRNTTEGVCLTNRSGSDPPRQRQNLRTQHRRRTRVEGGFPLFSHHYTGKEGHKCASSSMMDIYKLKIQYEVLFLKCRTCTSLGREICILPHTLLAPSCYCNVESQELQSCIQPPNPSHPLFSSSPPLLRPYSVITAAQCTEEINSSSRILLTGTSTPYSVHASKADEWKIGKMILPSFCRSYPQFVPPL